jgi:hypothetical protein
MAGFFGNWAIGAIPSGYEGDFRVIALTKAGMGRDTGYLTGPDHDGQMPEFIQGIARAI